MKRLITLFAAVAFAGQAMAQPWKQQPEAFDFEAKAGEAVKAASMKRYIKDFEAETPIAVRLSMKNLSYDGKILNVPLFMIDELKRLIMTIEGK